MSGQSMRDSVSVAVSPEDPPDTFRAINLWSPRGARGVFGGQIIAQALSAGSRTIQNGKSLHSQHCYFILPPDGSLPLLYQVEKLRDGKSYASRLIKVLQEAKVVAMVMASYAVDNMPPWTSSGSIPFAFAPISRSIVERPANATGTTSKLEESGKSSMSHSLRFAVDASADTSKAKAKNVTGTWRRREGRGLPDFSPRYALPFPDDVMAWEDCEPEEDRWSRYLETEGRDCPPARRKAIQEYIEERRASALGITVAKRKHEIGSEDSSYMRMVWMKMRLKPGERPTIEESKAMIACLSDFQFIGTAARSIGLSPTSNPKLGMLTSLDHTLHFYPFPTEFDVSRPLLHVMETTIVDVGPGRGFVRGAIFTEGGVLVALTEQEGVVRAAASPSLQAKL